MQFTKEQFIEIFINYNQTVFPVQILLYILSLFAIYSSYKKYKNSDKYISIILAFFWLWMGIVYHLIFFSTINKAAYLFGSIYIIQAILFFYSGVIKNKLIFGFQKYIYTIIGSILIAYGILVYPVLGIFLGHVYPASPTFGLPCPTTIFTFGILLWSNSKLPAYILIIPAFWAITGFFAALNFGIYEDVGLLLSGAAGVYFTIKKNRNLNPGLAG